MPVEGTLAGRAFSDLAQHVTTTGAGRALWTPLLDGTERLGVLQLEIGTDVEVDEDLLQVCADVAALLAELVITRSLYGDAVERARRSAPMSLPAELQWRLLPPLTFVSPRAAVAGILAPAHDVAGDSFDYALNGDVLHVAVVDAMGHGLESTLLAAVAVGGAAQRPAARAGPAGHGAGDGRRPARAVRPGPLRHGHRRRAGHRHRLVALGDLRAPAGAARARRPGGQGARRGGGRAPGPRAAAGTSVEVGYERLEPRDRLLLYTDGVVEARDAGGEFFGTDRLAELVTRQDAARRPAAETLRRLNHAILAHQEGELQDDATTVLVEWLTDEPDRSTPLEPEMPPS